MASNEADEETRVIDRPQIRIKSSFEYEAAYSRFLSEATRSEVEKDEFVGILPSRRIKHAGNTRYVFKERVLDKGSTYTSTDVRIKCDSIRTTDVGAHAEFVKAMAEGQLRQMVPQMCELMGEITELTERALPAVESGFSWDNYLLALERVEIGFEDDGTFEWPKVFVHPKVKEAMQSTPFPVGFENRLHELISKKREAWFAKKRSRRLS
jgi:hypothetical protein